MIQQTYYAENISLILAWSLFNQWRIRIDTTGILCWTILAWYWPDLYSTNAGSVMINRHTMLNNICPILAWYLVDQWYKRHTLLNNISLILAWYLVDQCYNRHTMLSNNSLVLAWSLFDHCGINIDATGILCWTIFAWSLFKQHWYNRYTLLNSISLILVWSLFDQCGICIDTTGILCWTIFARYWSDLYSTNVGSTFVQEAYYAEQHLSDIGPISIMPMWNQLLCCINICYQIGLIRSGQCVVNMDITYIICCDQYLSYVILAHSLSSKYDINIPCCINIGLILAWFLFGQYGINIDTTNVVQWRPIRVKNVASMLIPY